MVPEWGFENLVAAVKSSIILSSPTDPFVTLVNGPSEAMTIQFRKVFVSAKIRLASVQADVQFKAPLIRQPVDKDTGHALELSGISMNDISLL